MIGEDGRLADPQEMATHDSVLSEFETDCIASSVESPSLVKIPHEVLALGGA